VISITDLSAAPSAGDTDDHPATDDDGEQFGVSDGGVWAVGPATHRAGSRGAT
jgi:hypothetical protein